jgi:dTDP-4-dehydrorhamnose reductase
VKSILVVGGSGFVGSHLARHLSAEYKVVTTHFRHAQKIPGTTDLPLSVAKLDWIKELLFTVQPDIILYAAGRNILEWTEDPKNAKALDLAHAAGPAALLSASQILGSRFVYLSTPLVFDGTRGNYHESDIMIPSTALGKAKVNGENSIRSRALNFLVLRSTPLLGRGPATNPSFLDQWLGSWGRGNPVTAQDGVRHNYATIENFCAWVSRCLESPTKNRILHFGGLSRTSEYELALQIAQRLKVPGELVQRKSTPTDARADYSLNFTQSVKALEIEPLLLKQSLDLLEQHLLVAGA